MIITMFHIIILLLPIFISSIFAMQKPIEPSLEQQSVNNQNWVGEIQKRYNSRLKELEIENRALKTSLEMSGNQDQKTVALRTVNKELAFTAQARQQEIITLQQDLSEERKKNTKLKKKNTEKAQLLKDNDEEYQKTISRTKAKYFFLGMTTATTAMGITYFLCSNPDCLSKIAKFHSS